MSGADTMTDPIHLTVATVVHRRGRFLVVIENDGGRTVINQPAGHVEAGESLQEAALRETLEETGWHVRLTGFLGITHYRSPHNGRNYYRVSFAAEPLHEEEDAELDGEIIETRWLSRDEIASSGMLRSPMVHLDVEKHFRNEVYPIDLVSSLSGSTS